MFFGGLDTSEDEEAKQLGLEKCLYCNDPKVSQYGCTEAISRISWKMSSDSTLKSSLRSLSGRSLVCHCTVGQQCHGDVIIKSFKGKFSGTYDREILSTGPPAAEALNFMDNLREEPPSDSGSSADEGAPSKGAGWRGHSDPMMMGTGYTTHEPCDGQSLSSPRRWSPDKRRYTESHESHMDGPSGSSVRPLTDG